MSPAVNRKARNDEEIRVLFADILTRIRTGEDPASLNEYRRLVRKNVPFFMRSYFAAYLFMQIERSVPRGAAVGSGKAKDKNRRRDGERKEDVAVRPSREKEGRSRRSDETVAKKGAQVREERPKEIRSKEEDRRPMEPRHSIPEAEAAILFFGAGRNRRAYARELLSLMKEHGIDTDNVGDLRVLDNFSFVQVRRDAAESVIAALNGAEFRGRSLAVSYAKPRKEESSSVSERVEDEPYGETETAKDDSIGDEVGYAEDDAATDVAADEESSVDEEGLPDDDEDRRDPNE